MRRYLPIAGLLTGAAVSSLAVYLYVLTPVLLGLLAAASAISPKSRPFAIGMLAAAAGSIVFMIVLAIGQTVVAPGTSTYGP
ncbi:hypothetical protein BKG83_00195 [Mycobacteroides chelonae]|uniref:hypothetical protein n=1 Tax=Mycobacteroides chelonae TaxID=1774 RepID=UPI00092137F8|nr:hypothetical protein [Mycobacteroides chelonae]MBF9522553.1 hypothetical protein [Mycobacteroides chelonae]OHU60569.1 hypothetical protein BKG83_00195 [Mycobacteroides chelonae]PKQ56858.1 hypothetical protein B5566_16845 [Mycobacterium sp. MHSD3]GLE57361.1 hypothetical protein NJBCHELONAE_26700 [Mycobacteroides chelonae]